MPKREISDSLADYIMSKMSMQGLMFFIGVYDTYGTLNAVLPGRIPHPVHLREGMAIRNLMRDSKLCEDWDAHDFDDSWEAAILAVFAKYKKELKTT